MPRYCAASCCHNRGGRAAEEPRRRSFYPFPIHDEKRLCAWLQNMKRGSWIPSKHHFLCSDHFTPDSFDVRWGIRYLKQNAVPTIFSIPQSQQERDYFRQKLKKIKTEKEEETCSAVEPCMFLDPCSETKNLKTMEKVDPKAGISCFKRVSRSLQTNTMNAEEITFTIEKSIKMDHETHRVFKMDSSQDIDTATLQTSLEKLVNVMIQPLEAASSDVLESENEIEPLNKASTENPHSQFGDSSMVLQQRDNSSQKNTVTETNEQFTTNKQSVITILLPVEYSTDQSLVTQSFVPAEQHYIQVECTEFEDSSYNDIDSEAEVLQIEHSYCRQDFDREDLWQKIAKLHSKIKCLEGQENNTLSRLKSLEALIGKLKQENLLSEEKLKIVENCFTTFEVTMI